MMSSVISTKLPVKMPCGPSRKPIIVESCSLAFFVSKARGCHFLGSKEAHG